jgi:hypothetical protein
MLTDNAYRGMAMMMKFASTVTVTQITGVPREVPFIADYKHWLPSHLLTSPTIIADGWGVWFGTGTTPATRGDYNLSGERVTTIEFATNVTQTETADGGVATAIYTITNTGSEAITIGEVATVNYILSNNGANAGLAMHDRTVLEAPVTIEPDGVGQVTYTIRMNFPV